MLPFIFYFAIVVFARGFLRILYELSFFKIVGRIYLYIQFCFILWLNLYDFLGNIFVPDDSSENLLFLHL